MKTFYARTLILLLALTWLIPKANAATYFSYSGDTWDNFYTYTSSGTINTGTFANNSAMWFQGAVANGRIYSLPATMGSTTFDRGETGESLSYLIGLADAHYITRGLYFDFEKHGAEYFSTGNYSGYPVGTGTYWYAGPAIASDNAETLWMATLRSGTKPSDGYDGSPWNGGIKAVAYYKKENLPAPGGVAGIRVGIDLSSYNIGRSDLMSAYGDGANGEGNLWFCDYTNNKIVRVKIVNGQAAGETEFTPPAAINNARCRAVQYSDNRVIFSNGRDGNQKIYRGVINGNSITWYDLGITTVGSNASYGCPGATMFIMGGYEYLAFSSATNAFSIYVYDGTNPSNTTILDSSTGINIFSGSGSSWVNHNLQAIVADDKKSAIIYAYTPSRGAFKRKLTALKFKDPVRNFAVEIVKDQDPTQLSRQDAVLTWQAPASGTVSKYTVYSRENPWYSMEPDPNANPAGSAPLKRQHTWSAWETIGTTTQLTFTDINVSMYASSIPRSYQYKVVPTFTDGGVGAESNILEITPPLVPFVPVWDTTMDQDDIKLGIDRYDGYCKVQLYWKFPQVNNYNYFPSNHKEVYGVKPDYYSILRNGEEIVPYITCYNYIDTDVKSDHTYTYEIVSHYSDHPELTATSTPNTVYVAKRDWAKVGYELTEIYNYKIAASGDSVHVPASTYTNMIKSPGDYYQGAYHDGYWYVSQLSDDAASPTGGIIKISAAAPWENKTENILTTGTRIKSYAYWLSNGIAADYEGNLFVQSSTFGSRLNSGRIYINNGNGNFTEYTVNLSGINLTEYTENNAEKYLTTAAGRVDYYSMSGKLKSTGKAYLYLAPSVSRAVFVVELTYNGSSVTASLINKYQNTTSTSRWTQQEFLQANESLCIPVNCTGRENEFLHLIRSSGMTLMKINRSSTLATPENVVYDTQSRVNTPGGCTLEFNGELFLITPTSQYSVNKGNFYVGMAERGDGDTPTTANLSHIIPVAMWTQDDAEDGGGNASGTVSIFAEVGDKDINGDGKLNDYAYIYVFAPNGYRFAKYRLTPSTAFPPSQVTLEINAKYAEDYDETNHNPGGDITQFNATASWPQVADYGTTEGGNAFYNIQSYTLQLVDAAGNPINETNASGNLLYPAIEFDVDANGVPTKVYTVTYNGNIKTKTAVDDTSETFKNLSYTTNDDGAKIYSYVYSNVKKNVDYTALVTVNYVGIDESNAGIQQKSMTTEWEDVATYTPVAPSGNVLVKVDEDRWSDWDADYQGNPANGGAKDVDDAYFDNYRICFDIENPDFGSNRVEPVTNYTISYNDGTNTVPVDEFFLYVGLAEGEKYTITGTDGTVTEYTVDHDGYIKITNGQIPGDYNFDSINTGGKPHVYWDMQDYTSAPGYDDGVNFTSSNNPSTWSYIVTANYAANNARISEVAPATMGTDGSGITTGVEIISTQSRLNIYPIPATITITIKCSEAIEAVEIYSASGLLVKTVEGNVDQVMTIDVSDLASGYYFMRVNNLAPVKIIKN